MASNELILLIVCLLLAATSGLCNEQNESTAVVDHGLRSLEEHKGERQFFSLFKKWLQGYGAKENPNKNTQIKILPVYIPVPHYSDVKNPPSMEHYGAHQSMTMPYPNQVHHSHGQDFNYYIKEQGDRYPEVPYYTHFPSYPSVVQASEQHDTVVIDNPDLDYIIKPTKEPEDDLDIDLGNEEVILPDRVLVDHVRRRKKYKKKKLLRSWS